VRAASICRPSVVHISKAEGAGQHQLAALPSKSPRLNQTENVWQHLRGNWFSNRVFAPGHGLVDHCCHVWNNLVEQPWTIMSTGVCEWMHG
jgi:transposase